MDEHTHLNELKYRYGREYFLDICQRDEYYTHFPMLLTY